MRQLTGWTDGDGTGHEGYRAEDYFSADGAYLGPDEHGIEPIFATDDTHTLVLYLQHEPIGSVPGGTHTDHADGSTTIHTPTCDVRLLPESPVTLAYVG